MKNSKVVLYVVLLGIILIFLGWVYSYRYQVKLEYDDTFSEMNDAYRHALRGMEKDSQVMSELITTYRNKWDIYFERYSENPPGAYRFYSNWTADLEQIDRHLRNTEAYFIIEEKDKAYVELNSVRLIWRNIYMHGKPMDYRFYIIDLYPMIIKVEEEAEKKSEEGVQKICPDLKNSWGALKDKTVDLQGEQFEDYTYRVTDVGARIMDLCDLDMNLGRLPRLGSSLKNTYDGLYLNFG